MYKSSRRPATVLVSCAHWLSCDYLATYRERCIARMHAGNTDSEQMISPSYRLALLSRWTFRKHGARGRLLSVNILCQAAWDWKYIGLVVYG